MKLKIEICGQVSEKWGGGKRGRGGKENDIGRSRMYGKTKKKKKDKPKTNVEMTFCGLFFSFEALTERGDGILKLSGDTIRNLKKEETSEKERK